MRYRAVVRLARSGSHRRGICALLSGKDFACFMWMRWLLDDDGVGACAEDQFGSFDGQ